MVDEKGRLRKAREQYEAMQARQKRVQDLREKLEKPGVRLRMCIFLGLSLLVILGFFDPIFKLLGLGPH